ncbi:hypothetical protein M5X00_29440 [Paenibacillus alvei]|nr:hypothetical protein [Paenibacillus alvei]EJW14160.1 hypothetical protein PAV_17c00080 [Paenibacillus alvei DSM 29]MBG9734552.1 hypothetical protein [Paenibacillus alvei]MBG9743137.1 hypothetical protein [Paenibacillus alvei]MCY9539169.1 hypothetical protein [Paenibacillus alvei]MCY9579559.1 hypothetical protein [Paenibacillus alvei]
MGLQAKVVNQFREKDHDDHIYEAGDVYPAEGYKTNLERIEFLANVHPQYKKIFLADIHEIEEDGSKGEEDFPKHAGGGTYELSNGEKVKGKKEAIEAEKALKSDANVDHT